MLRLKIGTNIYHLVIPHECKVQERISAVIESNRVLIHLFKEHRNINNYSTILRVTVLIRGDTIQG